MWRSAVLGGGERAAPPAPQPPAETASVRARLKVVLWAAAWLALTLSLATRRAEDPGFSTTGQGGPVLNLLGVPGAWLADALLVLFGFSAWWLVVAGARHGLLAL